MYIYYKIYKSMRKRIHGEIKMKNSRTKTQTKLRNCIKPIAGALLLAIMFVLVFAGTLSGAFGIESDLQQNGIIENNVASAAWDSTSKVWTPNSSFTNYNTTTPADNLTSDYPYSYKNYSKNVSVYSKNAGSYYYASLVTNQKMGFSTSREYPSGISKIDKDFWWGLTFSGSIARAFENGALSDVKMYSDVGVYDRGGSDKFRMRLAKAVTSGVGDNIHVGTDIEVSQNKTGKVSLETTASELMANATSFEDGTYSWTVKLNIWEPGQTAIRWSCNGYVESFWLDIYTNDNNAPTFTSVNRRVVTFEDSGAGIYKIYRVNGSTETEISSSDISFSNNTRKAVFTENTYQTTYKYKVVDNVGNSATYDLTDNFPKYTVKYDSNKPEAATDVSVSGAMGTTTFQYDIYSGSQKLAKNNYILPGYVFLGWSTEKHTTALNELPSGGYEDEAVITSNIAVYNASEITLYAVWQELFAVIYHKNNGQNDNVPADMESVNHDITPQIALKHPSSFSGYTYSGYYFAGWEDSKHVFIGNAGDKIDTGNNGTRLHVYAVWKPISYTINFVSTRTASGTVGSISGQGGKSSEPMPRGYTMADGFFTYWTWNATGSGNQYRYNEKIGADDLNANLTKAQTSIDTASVTITMYAQWVTNLEFGNYDGHLGEQWGSQSNPYVIRTATHLSNLATIVNGGCATRVGGVDGVMGSIVGSAYAYATNPLAAVSGKYAGCYFVLDGDISMTYTSSFSYSSASSNPTGNNGETAAQLFDGNTSTKLCASNATSIVISVRTNVPIIVNSYSWWTGNDTSGNTGRNPNYFKIEGSTDGLNWYVIDERSGSWTTANNTQVDVTGMNGAGRAGRYNRFRITSTCSGGTWQASEFKFNNTSSEKSAPIGNSSDNSFAGTFDGKKFDGQNYTISGFATDPYANGAGLFGYVKGGTIKNVNMSGTTINNGGSIYHGMIAGVLEGGTITDCTVQGWVWGSEYVGGVVGRISGASTITNCTVLDGSQVNWNGASGASQTRTGGIVGGIDGGSFEVEISNCTNNAIIENKNGGTYGFGGIVGYNSGQTVNITSCTNNGEIKGTSETGGIIGYTDNSTIKDCTNNAKVGGVDNVGGIVGKICAGSVENCINKGAVSATSQAGGIIGNTNGVTVKNCKNETGGTVTATGNAAVGGIVGGLNDGGTLVIEKCENNAAINASNANGVAGIVGHNPSSAAVSITVTSCKNTGAVVAKRNAGGIGGRIETTKAQNNSLVFKNCYNSGEIKADAEGTVGGIVGYLYANGMDTVDVGIISYCFNQGKVSSTSGSLVGSIVGCLRARKTSGSSTVDTQAARAFFNYSTVDMELYGGNQISSSVLTNDTNFTIKQGTVAPPTKNGGSFLIYDSSISFDPVYFDGSKYVDKNWDDILTTDINGFKVTASVGENQYFKSDNGLALQLKYVTPSKTQGFSGNRGTVIAWYRATIDSDISASVKSIELNDADAVYDGSEHVFSATTQPSLSDRVNGGVYSVNFEYRGKNYGESIPKYVDVYDTTTYVYIGEGEDRQLVGVKTGNTYTINKATLSVGWEWSDRELSNLFDRTGSADGVQFVYNKEEQGLASVSSDLENGDLFAVSGSDLTGVDVDYYSRTYTLKDTRNYKLQNANNNNADLSGTTVTFEWKIRKNRLTLSNVWVRADADKDSIVYTFEYNAKHQGITENGIGITVENDTTGADHHIDGSDYSIGNHVNTINAASYTRTFTILDTRNYEVGTVESYVSSNKLSTTKGVSINDTKSVVTYSWKILPYNIEQEIAQGKVWFGANTNLIVGNQLVQKVKFDDVEYNYEYYPLQNAQTGVQQVLVYSGHNYELANFVVYVMYNDGTIAKLTQGTEYNLSALASPTVENPAPINTSITATGVTNFDGDITKWYAALFSDFGWKEDKSPSDANWGSIDNPYVIDRPEYLLRLSQIVNGEKAWNSIGNTEQCYAPQTTATATNRSYSGTYFLVTDDIDMSGYISTDGKTNFLPIGTRTTQNQTELPFSATFDGGGNTITYVYNVGSFYNDSEARKNYVGLFGYLNGATVTNLKVASENGYKITVDGIEYNGGIVGGEYVGGIAGYAADSTLLNVDLTYGGWVRGQNYVGGVVGYGERVTVVIGDASYSLTNANVGGENYVGGIFGKWIVSNQNQIGGNLEGQRYVTTTGQTDVMGVKYVGGIAGWMDTSSSATTISYTPQLNNNGTEQNLIVVGGIEYVGALFGVFVGNGYHQSAINDKYTAIVIDKVKVGNVNVFLQKADDKTSSGKAKVIGGLVGYAEGVGILFNTDWTTSNVAFDTGNYTPSFIGGIAGVLGKNATIEAIYQLKNDGTFLTGGTHTITHSVPDAQKTFGTAAKPLGSFVGGIVGYVSSQAGVYWETGTTIFGNGISLVNSAAIYATSYAGGIFGALGDISASDASVFESDAESILYKVLTTGVREGSASTTLGLAPTVDSNGITAQGRLINNASISASGSYAGGIAGYGGAKVRFVLRNTPQDSAIDVSKLNIYSGGSDISINGSYAGGIAGFLADNIEHDLQYIVVRAKFNANNQNATRVGGLVGYMGSGNVANCVVTNGSSSAINVNTDTYQGSEYVGGLVGETQNASIRNSVSTGFNLDKTSNTKGGLLGYGTNPTIDSSWTFYIAKSGATYSTVSQNSYGEYILVDNSVITANDSSYPTFENLCGFAGIASKQGVTKGVLEFAINVPTQRQLAFYNASGSDVETSNKDSFKGFENNNDVLTIKLDMETGTSMQVCVVDIEFVNVPKNTTDNDDIAKKVVADTFKKPSNSTRYHVQVTQASFDIANTQQVTRIKANVYFDWNNDGQVALIGSGTVYGDRTGGEYDSGELTPGSKANPYTISNQQEWNDFAYSVYNGRTYVDTNGNRQYVKLLVDVMIGRGYTNFANNSTYNFAGDVSKDSNVNNFRGIFDGNGHTITVSFSGIKQDRASVFPNASGAIFRNLTISGTIHSNTASSDTDYAGKWNAGYDVAGFVGKPFGDVYFYNCTNLTNVSGLRNVGGFVGYTEYSVYTVSCVNKGDIYSSEGINIKSESEYSWVDNQLESSDSDYKYANVTFGTGGIIGNSNLAQTIESCMNTGNISGGHNIGGIIGRANGDLTINNCANVGNILGHSGAEKYGGENTEAARKLTLNYAGGIVGKTSKNGTINMYASYNKGTVTGWGSIVGGVIGSIGDYIFGNANISANDETRHKNDALAKISYCYNTGLVQSGGTFAKESWHWSTGRLEVSGTVAGGIAGSLAHSEISYCYNTGEVIIHSLIGGRGTWQARVGGITGQVLPNKNSSEYVNFSNCYNAGYITLETAGTNLTAADPRYGASISGYCDNSDSSSRVSQEKCFGVGYCVRYRNTRRQEEYIYNEYNKYNTGTGWRADYMEWGTTLNSLADFTAVMNSDGSIKPNSAFGTQHVANANNLEGYVYMPGCLPQLAVFAVDTYNGLSMSSVGFGKNIYGEYDSDADYAGSESYPYIIRDGIDLLGVQALVEAGYSFKGKYIEFANGTNNITLDRENKSVVSKEIDMPTSESQTTKLPSNTTAYKAKGVSGNYTQTGKSYHLFSNGAICGTALIVAAQTDLTVKIPSTDGGAVVTSISVENNATEDVNDAYTSWLKRAYYYDGAYNYINDMANTAVFKVQNMIAIGRNGKPFKGSISGEQSNGTNTVINNLRVMTGKTIGGAYSGLFGQIENAYIGYIEVSGDSRIWSFSANESDISSAGGIVGNMQGNSTVEHCAISGKTSIGAFGKADNTTITSDITFAGGIVGLVDTKQSDTYNAGVVGTIKDCTINITTSNNTYSGIISGSKSNIGGVLGYVEGGSGASGKSNSVRIEGCSVDKAVIQAASSANTSSQIGGILGYGSQYVAAFITGCEVGVGGTVSIKGEHSLGGIAGGMSNAKGGYIDSCTVGANTTIERIAVGGDGVQESAHHGTAIGGLVGFTQNSDDTTSPLTTTFSGKSAFNGTIIVSVAATNPSSASDAAISCIGGIVGDMGSGANFASGSEVTIGGSIKVTLAAANVGGVAGRTDTATFIGKFNVAPTMETELTENVGGFIGKNIGTVYILADTTDRLANNNGGADALNGTSITISGTIKGISEVGGFIGVNNSGSTLNIGSNVANAKAYRSGTLNITITASVTGSGDNVGGIVGKNEGVSSQNANDYATVDIVKGTIEQNGAIVGVNNVGGIVGFNEGLLTTGGGSADTAIGGVTLSDEQQNAIKNLAISNTGNVTGSGDYVGGVVGKLDSPSVLRAEDSDKGAIAGTFTNGGQVSGNEYVGGSLGYVGSSVVITAKGTDTVFTNTGTVTASGYYVGGSIGLLLGTIQGVSTTATVNFQNDGDVKASGYVGGSIGVLAGPVSYAQFVNSSTSLTIAAVNSVGGSVGYIGMPTPLKTALGDGFVTNEVIIANTHFEAGGTLTVNPTPETISAASNGKDPTGWGGVGGAIGVIGEQLKGWTNNTYYAMGNVIASGVNNVGGVVGLIRANNIQIGHMLAYNTKVSGANNVGGIVGATIGTGTVIDSAYAVEGEFSGDSNVGGIIGLAQGGTNASTSYWVKGYANSDIATYDVADLSRLGFTTGKAETGWFFLYANDANGSVEGLGTINTRHTTNSDLQYWKRIADAYTVGERDEGLDKTDLKSNIVYGGGSPQLSTLYATATAASVSEKGYYMYTATSNDDVKPSVLYDKGVYYVSVKTNDKDAAGNNLQAQNVAMFYRSVSSSKDALVYNGYLRNAIIGLDGVDLYETAIKDDETPTIEDHKGQYIFTATTTIKNADGSTSEVNEAQSDPNTYSSVIKIYYVDDNGTARLVGGNTELAWKITERELTVKFEKVTSRVYGTGTEDNTTDMTITISNIAPNRGMSVPIKITVAVDKEDIVVYTWNGTSFTGSNAGVKLAYLPLEPNGTLSDEDKSSTSEDIFNTSTYQLVARLFFTEAKSYTITVSDGSSGNTKARYVFKGNEGSATTEVSDDFTVDPAELELSRTTGGSHAFDNTSVHGATWTITGFKYKDGFSQLAMFKPVFTADGKSSNMYDSSGMKASISDLNGPIVSISQSEGTNKTITIELSTVRKLGDYYINFEAGKVGENTYRVGNYKLSFTAGQNEYHIVKTTISISSNLTSTNNKKVYNQKTSVITVTFTASAAGDPSFSGIYNFEEFLTRFFAVKDTAKFSKVDIPTSSNDVKKTVTWTFTTKADAVSYVIELIEGKDHVAEEANCAHDPDKLPTYTYTINKRPITLSATETPLPTGKTNYVYNTEHQGINEVSVNQGSQSNEIGLLTDDAIVIKISGSVSGTLTFKNKYSQSANIFTADANTYTASFSLSGNNNYTLSSSSLSWTIEQYVVKVGAFSLGSGKTYDGTAVTPTITIVGISGSNGTYTYENDTFTLTYSIEKDGGSAYESGKLVNAGTYKIKVGGTNGKIVARRAKGTGAGSDTSNNYKFDSSNSTADYTINACPIAIEWNYPTLVYTGNNQNITIKSITVNGKAIAMTSNSVKSGLGNDVLTFTLSGGGVNAGSYTTKAELSSVSGTNEGVDSVVGNYTPKLFTSDPFTIVKSKVGIRYNGGTANKVYDANENVKDNNFTFAVYSTNGGANGSDDLFTITMSYDNKNVSNGYTKTINFKYAFKSVNTNYELDASVATSQSIANVGQITPAHIRVALDKLRSGKATRTYTDDEYYGGAEGATGNGRSKTYRTGEGFTVSGVLGSDNINVVARYQEADNTRNSNSGNYFDFSKYVNDVYKDADGTFKKASAGTYFKKLVFTMTGTDAANYTFNVYDSSAEGGNKYSESDSTADAIQIVTVYDSRDSKNSKNASGTADIQIEITVKSVRVEYANTAQSYANDDNTYNTDWTPITGTNKDMDKADAKIKVSNGWMYADGKDHTAEEGYTKREYHGYTTIRGSQTSERLGAKVDPKDGMDLNYRLSNQPTLTIAYFVPTGDAYEINSLARLLIASFYYTASQNPGDLEIIKIVSSGYKWVSVVSADDYDKGEFKLPQDTPITDSKATSWDEYFAELEAKGYSVFLNIDANNDAPANTWGYYTTTTSESSAIPTNFVMTKDIVGKFTESDISILNTFFTVIGADGQTTTSTWSGNGTYLKNVLKAAEGKIATINGSLFVSTAKAEGASDVTGFSGMFDGNGYTIEYLNIMGYGVDNAGLFDVIGANGVVKNLHLRNVTINGNAKYVGGIAGKVIAAAEAASEKDVKNVSFHGSINVTGSTDQSVGGLFGTSERVVDGAIVLGSITVSNANAKVGGVVGSSTIGMSNVVTLMQIDANCNVGAFSQTNTNVTDSYHLKNAVWRRDGSSIAFVNHANAKTYDELMGGSVSGYGTTNKYYHESETSVTKGEYDVLDDVVLTKISVDNKENARQSMRLADIVKVYLLMYSLSETHATDSGDLNGANVYAISTSSWLVGEADGTSENAIFIANKQNVSLLRELRFASFTLRANVSIEIASTFSGAFYGSVNAGAYKIACDKAMFEAYANDAAAWLSVQ